jgi:hypothetical protein
MFYIITSTGTLNYESEIFILNGKGSQSLVLAQMPFSKQLIFFTRSGHQRNADTRE